MTSKLLRRVLIASAAALIGLSGGVSAFAGSTVPIHARNVHVQGVADATANQTFATTSYADLAAATVQVTPQSDPNATFAPGTVVPTDYLLISWSADVTKATATTGTCAVYVNGAILATTARTSDTAAKENSIGGAFLIPNTTTGTQTVKLQCKSGDTNVLTVALASISVIEII